MNGAARLKSEHAGPQSRHTIARGLDELLEFGDGLGRPSLGDADARVPQLGHRVAPGLEVAELPSQSHRREAESFAALEVVVGGARLCRTRVEVDADFGGKPLIHPVVESEREPGDRVAPRSEIHGALRRGDAPFPTRVRRCQ